MGGDARVFHRIQPILFVYINRLYPIFYSIVNNLQTIYKEEFHGSKSIMREISLGSAVARVCLEKLKELPYNQFQIFPKNVGAEDHSRKIDPVQHRGTPDPKLPGKNSMNQFWESKNAAA